MNRLSSLLLQLILVFPTTGQTQEPEKLKAPRPAAGQPAEAPPAPAINTAKVEGLELVGTIKGPDGVTSVPVKSGETVPNKIGNGNPNMLFVKMVVAEGAKDPFVTIDLGGSSLYTHANTLDSNGNIIATLIALPADGQIVSLEAYGSIAGKPVRVFFQVASGRAPAGAGGSPAPPQFAPGKEKAAGPPPNPAQPPQRAGAATGRLFVTLMERGPTKYSALVSGARQVSNKSAPAVPTFAFENMVVQFVDATNSQHLQQWPFNAPSTPYIVVQEQVGNGTSVVLKQQALAGTPSEVTDILRQYVRR